MKILVTGAKGMVGTALVNNLRNIRDGKNWTRPGLQIDEVYEYDINSTQEELDKYCQNADFVFNLAGVNRPQNSEDFMKGNFGFASDLLECLKKHNNKAGIMLSSSIQATLSGRFGDSEYGRSKQAGEDLFFKYAKETGAKVAVYRFPNLMGHVFCQVLFPEKSVGIPFFQQGIFPAFSGHYASLRMRACSIR